MDIDVWLYIPMTNSPESPSVRAWEAWNSASISQNPDIELFATSSGKPSLRPLSWRGWKTRRWIARLSGTMSSPSTAALGVARFISSLGDIRVSRSPSPAAGGAPTIPGTCGPTSGGSSPRSGPNGASSRTSRDISPWKPPTCSRTFERWATASKRACSRRSKPAQARYGAGSSLWPTPTKSLYCNRAQIELGQALKFRDDPAQSGSQLALGKVARTWTLMWLLTTACGGRPTRPFSFPSTRPLHISLTTGARYSAGDLIFNPSFSDWLMGWPIGWTDPTRPVTGWSAWLRRMRGALCALPSPSVEGP